MVYYTPNNDPIAKPEIQQLGPPKEIALDSPLGKALSAIFDMIETQGLPPAGLIHVSQEGANKFSHAHVPLLVPLVPITEHQFYKNAGGKKEKLLIVDPGIGCFTENCEGCEQDGDCTTQDSLRNATVIVKCNNCRRTFVMLGELSQKFRAKWDCLLSGSIVSVLLESCKGCGHHACSAIINVLEIRKA